MIWIGDDLLSNGSRETNLSEFWIKQENFFHNKL